jgi:hypothetical protein
METKGTQTRPDKEQTGEVPENRLSTVDRGIRNTSTSGLDMS